MKRYRVSALVVAAGCASFASASGLAVGDMAPPIQAYKWVQGDPVQSGPGNLRVLEFWTTWYPPCKDSVPVLTDLAKKYKGKVTVTGVDVFERSPDAVSTVKAFVKAMGSQMGYKVAVDDPTGTMGKTWIMAAKQNTLPVAFVIDAQGRVAWIGDPSGLAPTLDQILAGKYDLAKAKADFVANQQKELAAQQSAEQAQAAAQAADQGARKEISAKILEAEADYKAGKKGDALAVINKLEASYPQYKNNMEAAKFMVLVDDDKAGASAIVDQQVVSAGKQAPYAYLQFGLMAAGSPKGSKENFAYAVSLADKALAKYASDPIVDYEAALIYHRSGNPTKAISLLQDAMKNLGNANAQDQGPLKNAIQKRVAEFTVKGKV